MIIAYARSGNSVIRHEVPDEAQLPPGTAWVDLKGCTPAQIEKFSRVVRQRIPRVRDVRLLEQAHQQFVEKGVTYLTAPIIIGSQTETPTSSTVLFILSRQLLITVRESESRAMSLFAAHVLENAALLHDSETVFVGLLEAIVHRLADLTEITTHELEVVSRLVFSESLQRSRAPGQGNPTSWRKIMAGLGRAARLNHKLMATLTGLDRLISFIQSPQEPQVGETSYDRLRSMQHDIRRLIDHSGAMIGEATFLLDAIASAISIEQNNVVKTFSMVAVILMPPTMVASIYGMNFVHMPELQWYFGYPLALLTMLLSAVLPWLWFKKRGWF